MDEEDMAMQGSISLVEVTNGPRPSPYVPVSSRSFTDLDTYAAIERQNTSFKGEEWRCIQQVTFTNWFNDRLRGRKNNYTGPIAEDLSVDLADGTLLIRLLENLTSKKFKRYEKNPTITAQKMVNLDIIFNFIREEGIKLIGIGSHNVFQGNNKLILGLVWTLIQKYQIKVRGSHTSTKAVMVQWLQALLPSWNITNLTTDWNDGRALMALINEVKPGIGPSVSTLDPTKRRNNCTMALKVAYNHLKIPKLISPENLSSSAIDEQSVMTYLSYFCDPAKTKLLKWVKKIIPQMKISNFTTDWADGRAFAALTEACFPGMFPDWATLDRENKRDNIARVFDINRKRLSLQPSFSASELESGNVEDLQVMTYILALRNGEMKPLPDEIVVSGQGITNAIAGKQTQFEIDTTHAGPGRLFIDAYYENGKKVKFSLRETRMGIVTLVYTPESAGNISFDILWSESPITNSPFTVAVTDSTLVQIIDFERHYRLIQVKTMVELCLNTKKAGHGTITAELRYHKEKPVEAIVTNLPNSVVSLQYVPRKAGRPVLHVFWNGVELTHLSISYTVVDNDAYRVASKPEKKSFQTFESADFSVTSDGLPLDIIQMTAIYGDLQIPVTFKRIEGNTGYATFTPTLPGAYNMEIACIDKLIQGSPFTIDVSDPSRCKIMGTVPRYMKFYAPYEFQIHTSDAGAGELSFECSDRTTAELFRTRVIPANKAGIQIVEATPISQGEYLVGIKFHGTHIPSSPFRVSVCDPSRVKVSGDIIQKKSGIVGKPIRFKIQIGVPCEGVKPSVKAIGPSAKYQAEIRTTDDSTYASQFTPWEIGTHEISVTYGNFHIPKSPFLVAVAGLDSNICSATGTGLQEAYTGVPAQFVVIAKQSGLLEDGALEITVRGVVNDVHCKVRVRDNRNGSYNVAYLITVPGAYLVAVLAGGQNIPGSPFKLNAVPGPEADRCRMYGPILEPEAILTIGKPMDFSVDASEGGVGSLTVKAVGPGGAEARVYVAKADKRGTYDIKLDPVRHGKYRVSVKWSGKHIPGSPFLLKIFPGADSSKCKAYGPGLEDGEVGTPSTFIIETRDAGAGTLKVRLHGVKNAFKIEINPIDQRDVRTLKARYDPRKPGEYLVTIKWTDEHVPGSPFRVRILGEAIEDDETQQKATPRYEELGTILEDDENSDEAKSMPNLQRAGKKRNKRHAPPQPTVIMIPVPIAPGYIDPRHMPVFDPRALQTPYHYQFARQHTGVAKRSSKTLAANRLPAPSSLPSEKMVTFSGLQQVHRYKKATASKKPEKIEGDYHGHASMQMNTVTTKTVHKQMKKSSSESTNTAPKKPRKRSY